MGIRDEILEEILKEYKNPEDLIGKDGILKEPTKWLIQKAMESELTHHLGYDKYSSASKKSGNSRNGKSSKTINAISGRFPLRFVVTVTGRSILRSFPNTRHDSVVLMTRFFRCMPAGRTPMDTFLDGKKYFEEKIWRKVEGVRKFV